MDLTTFSCPRCTGTLTTTSNAIHCGRCNASYPIRDGILDFRCGHQHYYFNALPKSEMEELVATLDERTWPAAIRNFVGRAKNPNSILDNLIADGRYAWKLFLNLTPDTVMLDFGCGLGNLTKNLAPHVRTAYAMDLTFLRLEFAKKRFGIFGVDNNTVVLAGGDSEFLPFPSRSIDCITISGVLEWIGEAEEEFRQGTKTSRLWRMLYWHFGKRSARALQLRFLKEVRRVLKKDGQLFIAIENRFNYEYFTGRPDHHSGLKYGSLMPRGLANLYSIARKRKPYRTYTYSYNGYTRLLRQAGFPNIEFYGLSKGYSHLEHITPFQEVPGMSPRGQALKDWVKQSKYFVPAYGILASAAEKPWPRLRDQLLADLAARLCESLGSQNLTFLDYAITAKDKLIVKAKWGQKNIIVKIPLNQQAFLCEQQNAHLLENIHASSAIISERSPKPLAQGMVEHLQYFAEEQLTGSALRNSLRTMGHEKALTSVSGLLHDLNPEPPVIRTLTGDLYEKQVSQRLNKLFQVVSDPRTRQALLDHFRDRLYGVKVSSGLTHGDFSLSNIFATDTQVSGLIDWEAGESDGLPIIDAITYLQSAHRFVNSRETISEASHRLASRKWNVSEEWVFMQQRYTAYGIDEQHHEAFVHLSWLHHVTFQLQFSLIYDPFAIKSCIHRFIDVLLESNRERTLASSTLNVA